MTTNQKQDLKRSLQDAIRNLAEALDSIKEANCIIAQEIAQLHIERLLSGKKWSSQEELDLKKGASRLRFLSERLDTYADVLVAIAEKH